MFSFAIVVFREVLEIALILVVLLAATKGLKSRSRWFWIGLGGGILGSILVAACAQRISQAMEGMGQELFNALVLLSAAILIGWTVIWMRRHAQTLTQELKEAGRAVSVCEKPMYSLAVVIALAVLREGSEIVMFTYGSLAGGSHEGQIIAGSMLGLTLGVAIGFALYCGIMKISLKYIFTITSWLLICLAAGMASQAAGFLTAAGYIPELASPLWDTSHIMSESSLIGQILHTLIGYNDRPSGVQFLCYVITIGGLAFLLKTYGNLANVKKTA